jgi:hypothetical protein
MPGGGLPRGGHRAIGTSSNPLRGAPGDTSRGPVAFVINPDRIGFANVFADVTQGERPLQLFRSLHEGRAWLERTRQGLPNRQVAEP